MAITLTDGRGELYQWDTGRTLTVDDATVTQAHFQNREYGRTIDVDVVDGTAIIPDVLLQKPGELRVFAFVTSDDGNYTKVERVFDVTRRNKPNDYVYTPTEQKSLEQLQEQINKLDAGLGGAYHGIDTAFERMGDLNNLKTTAKDNLVAAINEAAQSGGANIPTPTATGYVPTSFARYSDDELVTGYTLHKPIRAYSCAKAANDKWMLVDLETGNKVAPSEIPDEPNVVIYAGEIATTRSPGESSSTALHFDGTSGAQFDFETKIYLLRHAHVIVDRRYSNIEVTTQDVLPVATPNLLGGVKPIAKTADMTQDVGIDPAGKLYTKAGSGGTDISLGVTAAVGQTIKVKTVDADGKPTAWEAADMTSGGSGETWELINTSVVPAETTKLTITQDSAGKPFAYYELKYVIQVAVPLDKKDATIWFSCQSKTTKNASVKINGTVANQAIVGYASSLGGFVGGGNSLTIQPDVFSYGFADTVSISKLTMFQMYASSASLHLPEGTKVSLFGRGK